jgi:FkbH-like protein
MDHTIDEFGVPRALRVTQATPLRALVVGSCFSVNLPPHLRLAGHDGDHVLFNHVGELPPQPPRPLADYDFQVVQVPVRSVLPEMAYFRLIESSAGYEALLPEAEERLFQLLAAAMRWNSESGLLTFVVNFLTPQQNPLGRMLPRHGKRNIVRLFQRLNESLSEEVSRYHNSYVIDCDEISASHGRRYVQDDVYMQVNHASPIADDGRELDLNRLQPPSRLDALYPNRRMAFMSSVIEEMLAMHRTTQRIDAVKLVIVDLDDTLWRGLVLEDWRGGGTATEGYPLGLAEALLHLKARGIVLAIVSKNDPDRIAQVWDHVWHGRLSLEDFAVRQINWRPKDENVAAVIRAVNVRPDSVVFIDDNPVERARVLAAFPDIRVLGDEPYALRRILLASPETQVSTITDESARRTEMVQAQVVREGARARMSREEFLSSLDVRTALFEIRGLDDPRLARCLELINKTSQFNTTGRRLPVEACGAAFADGMVLHAFEVEDRYVKYGLVGAAIARAGCIEQFVMSCRVIGLDVEHGVIAAIVQSIEAAGVERATAMVIDTGINHLCLDLYQRCGFTQHEGGWISASRHDPSEIQPRSYSRP